MKIYAPVKDTNGIRASVRFVDGVGETDNPHLIKWFESHGYTLEKCDEVEQKPVEKCDESEIHTDESEQTEQSEVPTEYPDFDAMTPNDLREWMKANGYGFKIKNIRSKDKLLEIIRG